MSYISADEAVQGVRNGDHIHLSSIASVPHALIDALCRKAGTLRDLHFHHFHTEGPAPYGSKEYEGVFFDQGFFVGPNVRKSVQEGYADYIPTHLSESQAMYRSGALPCDVAMVQVSQPVDGLVSLGTSVDCSIAALEVARLKLAVVNPNVPFAYGDLIPVDRFDALVWDETPLFTKDYVEPTATDRLIGRNCSELVPDGACLQMGIGALPNAVCSELTGHKHLGLHTEMFADGALELIRNGAAATFDVNFSVMPQRFLNSGEEAKTFTSSGRITNPTAQEAKPLLRVYGTGTFTIGSTSMQITAANSYTDIDCDICECYRDTMADNRNASVKLLSGEFPSLLEGDNGVTLGSGISRIIITPSPSRMWLPRKTTAGSPVRIA